MPINDLETRRLIAFASRYLNYGESRVEVGERMRHFFTWDSAAQIREGLDIALKLYQSARLIRQHIAGRGATVRLLERQGIGEYLATEPPINQTVGVTIYFHGHLENGQYVRGSTVVNVPADATIFTVQQRARAAIATGAITFPNVQYRFRSLSVSIQSVTPYGRGRAFSLDTEPITQEHPNPYTGPNIPPAPRGTR